MNRKRLDPNLGGCWFCYMDGCDAFSWEWDAWMHSDCPAVFLWDALQAERAARTRPQREVAQELIRDARDAIQELAEWRYAKEATR